MLLHNYPRPAHYLLHSNACETPGEVGDPVSESATAFDAIGQIRFMGRTLQPVSFERVAADGERYVPHRFRDGMYRVADPALGRTKHHAANQITITAEEIGDYLRKGFLLRMRGEISDQVNLISASEIKAISHSEPTSDQLSGRCRSHGVEL